MPDSDKKVARRVSFAVAELLMALAERRGLPTAASIEALASGVSA